MAAFAMTPSIQRRCNALIALHALHFSGHAAVAITQDQLLLNLVSQQIRLAQPELDAEAVSKRANTRAARVLGLVQALGPGLGALIVSPIVGGLADAYGRRWMTLAAPLGLALARLNLAWRPSVKAFVFYRVAMGPLGILMGRAILLARADMVPGHTLAFAKEVARQAQVNLVLGLVTTRLGSWLASRADKVGPDRALADSFALAGLINIAAMMGAFWLMAETLPRASRIPFSLRTSNPLSFVSFFGRSRMLLRLGIISSLMNICHQQSYEGLFHMRQYGWGVAQRTRHVMWHKLVQFFNFYPFPALAQRLGLYGTLKIGLRLSGVLWIGSALTRNGAVNYVDSVAMLGVHKLKVLEMAKAAEADRVGATYGQMRAAEVSLGRLLGMVFTPIWNEVYALGVRRGWTGGAHVLRGAIQLLCSEIALPGMFSGGLGVDDLEG